MINVSISHQDIDSATFAYSPDEGSYINSETKSKLSKGDVIEFKISKVLFDGPHMSLSGSMFSTEHAEPTPEPRVKSMDMDSDSDDSDD